MPLELAPAPPELELVPLDPALTPLELALVPLELELVPPELVPEPPGPKLAPLELELVPLEPTFVPPELVLVLPELELLPPVLVPLDPAPMPAVSAPELPFGAPLFEVLGEVSLEPPEQPPAAAMATMTTLASEAGRPMETTGCEQRLVAFAKFMGELYYVQANVHARTDDGAEPCSRTVNLQYDSSSRRKRP